ncbi:hypothetical protein PYW08_006269 [Mythimna loreyi]|uniref:Uncharacterized protein n=1 Tax=Mythimna loreyi TaxID=667449 RepID=A0ACC2QM80_9NEOP|nr:hypothetical protein PYW08_006269 [Mythimna loreyi]
MPGLSTIKFTTTSIERRPLKSIENVSNIFPSTSKASQLLAPEENVISVPAPTIEREKEKESLFPENIISSEVCRKDTIQIPQKCINKNVFAQLKARTNKMKPEDRLCALLFDEMSLKPSLNFNTKKDTITGFVTDGEETRPYFADHAQVFMVFSQTVASNMGYLADKGILQVECKDTADLLLFFDELFDSVNGSYANRKRFAKLLQSVKPNSAHHKK